MPQVPTTPGPTVENRPQPTVYQQGATDVAAFGGASAAGEAALGTSMQQTGDIVGKIGADMAIQQDMRSAKDASTQSMMYANTLGFKGDGSADNPNGFFAMRGQQALDYAPKYLAAIQGQADQTSQGLSERARNLFQSTMETHLVTQQASAQRFIMQQNLEANIATNNARTQAATSVAMNNYNDPAQIEAGAKIVRGSAVENNPGASPEVLAAKTATELGKYYGDLVKTALAKGDVTTAAGMFERYQTEMDPASRVGIADHLRVPLQNARANAAAAQYLGANTTIGDGTSMPQGGGVADKTLPPEQQAFLNTLAGPESAGKYNVRYTPKGAAMFSSFEAHPNIPESGPEGPSTAAGRYQFTKTTWDPIAQQIGATDFKPGSQDRGAMALAGNEYTQRTGRNLPDDLKEGGHAAEIAGALKGRWPSLPGGTQVGTTMEKFTAGLASYTVDAASSPQANANLAAATQIHPDFGGAKEAAIRDYGDDAEMLPRVLSAISRRESAYNLSVKSKREELGSKWQNDMMVALQNGRDDAVIPELAIRHAFEPAVADEIMNKFNEAREFGQTYKTVQTMTPEDYAAKRSELVASISGTQLPDKAGKVVTPAGTVPPPTAGITGIAQRQKELRMLDAAHDQVQAQIKADPASYVRSTAFPEVQAAFAGAKDPDSVTAAIQKSMATQRSLGVQDPRAISNTAAATLAHELNTTDPSKGDLGVALDAKQKQYGAAWPAVWKDIVRAGVNPQFAALAAMDTTEQTAARGDLTRALQDKAQKGDEFGKNLDPIQKSAAELQIHSNMAPLQRVLPAYNSNSTYTSVIMPAVQTLATHYMTQGMDGATAADKAYQGVIGSKYEFGGSGDMLMVPKTWQGQPLGVNKVMSAGMSVTNNLKDEDLINTTAREARRGTWATLPDGSGAGLLKQTTQGNWLPVQRKGGGYVTMRFGDLPQQAYEKAYPAVPF